MIPNEVTCRVPTELASNFIQCLYDWQTLFGGGLALIAAIATIIVIGCQIRQSDRHHRDEIQRLHNAARVALPLALSAISQCCSEISKNVADAIDEIENPSWATLLASEQTASVGLPPIFVPDEAIAATIQFVKTLSNTREVQHMAQLIIRLQILTSRYVGFDNMRADKVSWLYTLLIDCGIVSYLNNSVYNYARFAQKDGFAVVGLVTTDKAWEGVQQAIMNLLFTRKSLDHYLSEVEKLTGTYRSNGTSPWIDRVST